MKFVVCRIYDHAQPAGYRVLTDRLWPRGVTKQKANIDAWAKDLAPSPALRRWFNHDPAKWEVFRQRYRKELSGRQDEALALLKGAGKKPLVLLYGARDEAHTHALVLKDFLFSLR